MDDKTHDKRIFVFAGTSSARRLIEAYSLTFNHSPLPPKITAFTATGYGAELLKGLNCEVRSGRLDACEMKTALENGHPDFVIDALHPYAAEARANIKSACEAAGVRLMRLSRDLGQEAGDVRLGSAEEAAAFLREREGIIFLATGIKEAAHFADMRERVVIRVLPMDESLRRCRELGFASKNIIAMQGPFSQELNSALFRMSKAAWLVTKQSGEQGGFEAKLSAARACGIKTVVITPPQEPEACQNYSLEEILRITAGDAPLSAGCRSLPLINLVSAGPGDPRLMTALAREALAASACIVGARRLLESCAALITGKEQAALTGADEIISFIEQSGHRSFAVLVSGDSGFYSLAKTLTPKIREKCVQFCAYPGVSSLSLLAARLGTSWDDVTTISLHGLGKGETNAKSIILRGVKTHRKTFFLTDGTYTPAFICQTLCKHNLGDVLVSIGESLSLPEETIRQGRAADYANTDFSPLNAVLVENPAPAAARSIPDGAFTRGKVPMTKAEVRMLALGRLSLRETDLVWDVGAGTGAVSCEAALCAGRVFAIEREKEALDILKLNREALGAVNIEIVEGEAPEALLPLPAPDAVFIGGSGGRIDAIIDICLAKNPRCRVAVTAVTLETIAELQKITRRAGIHNAEITQIAVSRAAQAGNYHLLRAENPVFIVSFAGGEAAA